MKLSNLVFLCSLILFSCSSRDEIGLARYNNFMQVEENPVILFHQRGTLKKVHLIIRNTTIKHKKGE